MGLSSADDDNLNLHIVGPAATDDSRVLSDYLAGVPGAPTGARRVMPASAGASKPILFTTIQKRPLGITAHRSPSAEKLEIIEKLLAPYLDEIIDRRKLFSAPVSKSQGKISPAVLACLYAHMVVYCKPSFALAHPSLPDGRFIWNLANEALYSELHLSPGVSTITAILLNVGGRPTTSLIGNGVLLSSAVSIAHSLGLNRNPLDWNIPQSEKYLRMKIWWALLIQDKWTSLAHGTPPRISKAQQDVPLPTVQYLCRPQPTENQLQMASVFIALAGLTSVLDALLKQIYSVEDHKGDSTAEFELALHAWTDSLVGAPREIIMRGTSLNVSGASNFRLVYLSLKLLLQRMKLGAVKQDANSSGEQLSNSYFQGRQLAGEILDFTQNLMPAQLDDFWLSVGAFTYPATISFLLRHALETEDSPSGIAQTSSFQLAQKSIDVLRLHKQNSGWDMGDVCLAQYAEIVDKVLANAAPEEAGSENFFDLQNFVISDASILDQLFPGLWDPLENVW